MQTKKIFSLAIAAFFILGLFTSCEQTAKQTSEKPEIQRPVEWSKNANIYEVNIRQYTPEGTFNAFKDHLPRLKEMGVDILWLMPVHPIGELNRKGSMGSYYSVKDYKAVNPEFGTMEEFKMLVNKAHELGMYILIDWVANHSAWDNSWATTNPEYYKKDSLGNFVSPFDWTDVIAFDYSNSEMRNQMIYALNFWVKEANIDGYRCDVAGMVPVDFWEDAVEQLNQIKPVFMLAEDEGNDSLLHKAFDMNYAWEMHHIMNKIAKGEEKASDIWAYLDRDRQKFEPNDYRMNFTSNHDENSWNGTTQERLGESAQTFAALSYTLPGMPLIYSGQEVPIKKRLRFFEKDTIDWSDIELEGFYTTLNNLKDENEALWNGEFGGDITEITKGQNNNVFAFERRKNDNRVMGIFNLSADEQEFVIDRDIFAGDFTDVFSGEKISVTNGYQFELSPWEYIILKSN